jgi:hypothetical protein
VSSLESARLVFQSAIPYQDRQFLVRRLSFIVIFIAAIVLTLSAQYQDRSKVTWIEPNSGAVPPEFDAFDSNEGTRRCECVGTG